MDTLPLELLQKIFKLACIDGGRTGCALALTSRSIHTAVRTTRFHSVALQCDRVHLDAFLSLYKRESDPARGDKPRVSRLYLTILQIPHNAFPLDRWGARRANPLIPSDAPSDLTCLPALKELLYAVTDDLQSLVIQHGIKYPGGDVPLPIFDRPFPSLRELSFLGLSRSVVLIAKDSNLGTLFPTLTHLEIHPGWSCLFDTVLWVEHAPHLTDLHVSGIDHSSALYWLPTALGTRPIPELPLIPNLVMYDQLVSPPLPSPEWEEHEAQLSKTRTYPSLRRVVLQLQSPPSSAHESSWISYGQLRQELEWYVRYTESRPESNARVEMLAGSSLVFSARASQFKARWVSGGNDTH